MALLSLLMDLRRFYPDARILGHRDFPGVRKACPSFNAMAEYHHV
jgi:N-acetylmuramoyl-L-alanine amidase